MLPDGSYHPETHVVPWDKLLEVLDTYAPEEGERSGLPALEGDVLSAPEEWPDDGTTTPYIARMVSNWATDAPKARHPWILSCFTRLAAAWRLGRISAQDLEAAREQAAERFRELVEEGGQRDEQPSEIRDVWKWAMGRAARLTDRECEDQTGGSSGGRTPPRLTLLPGSGGDGDPGPTSTPTGRGGTISRDDILNHILEHYELHRTDDGGVAVTVDPTAPRSGLPLQGPELRSALMWQLWQRYATTTSIDPVRAATATAEGRATSSTTAPVRCSWSSAERVLWVDLGWPTYHVARIDARGVTLDAPRQDSPVFTRPQDLAPLPDPDLSAAGAGWAALEELLGLEPESFGIVRTWLVAATLTGTPVPILWFTGDPGSTKTTTARLVASILQPGPLGTKPRNQRALTTTARNRLLVTWDNVSSITEEESDWLCLLATGGRVDERALYTDHSMASVYLQRPTIVTSIALPHGLGGDALQRVTQVRCTPPREGQRAGVADVDRRMSQIHAAVLGDLLWDVAAAAQAMESEDWAASGGDERMSDYAAIAEMLGTITGYRDSLTLTHQDHATEDPFIGALLAWLEGAHPYGWEGNAKELLAALVPYAPADHRVPWPRTGKGVAVILSKMNAGLSAHKWGYTRRKTNRDHRLVFTPL